MIELRKITVDNFEECMELKLTKEQQYFIASNSYSLAEAYAVTNGPYTPMPYAIYNNETIVGFIMAEYEPIDDNDPNDDEDVYFISRIMIDVKYQGKGYAKKALSKMIDLMKTFPYGPATVVVTSYDLKNTVSRNLFKSFGFIETDLFDDDGDIIARLELL